jgi:hypothetical protein
MEKKPNKLVEALKEDFHLIGISGAALLAAVTGQFWLVGLGAAVGEALYLIFVPDSAWYRKRLDRRYNEEMARHRELLKQRLLHEIDEEDRIRFERLERLQRELAQQYSDPKLDWCQDVLRRVDYLVDHFLSYAHKAAQFERYLRRLWSDIQAEARPREEPSSRRRRERIEVEFDNETVIDGITQFYEREIAGLQARLRNATEAPQRDALTRHIDILTKRRENALRMVKFVQNLRHQMEIVEDLLGLLNDQMRAQSPQQILDEIDDVIRTSESVKQTLEEMAPLEEQIQRLQQGI